ncbi:MAG: ferritin-like domain-containing protein [Alphaproteobacteria bacterium]|nr:ferritin-like domain-containing protein [Alphaproteobacteria bacterium]
MLKRVERRFLDVLASIYIYNEYRGYSSIDRVLKSMKARHSSEHWFIEAVEKHRRDERKHYLMFKKYFIDQGRMPFAVDSSCGHIDRLIRLTFGCGIDDLDTDAVSRSDDLFFRLCRIIMITEIRGMNQLDILLEDRLVRGDPALVKIFKVIQKDEPSHWTPYRDWLEKKNGGDPRWNELAADWAVHKSLVFWKVPSLLLSPGLKRRSGWHDDGEDQSIMGRAA